MWVGILNDRLGPYVLSNRLSAAQYLEFLNNVLEKQLDVEVPLGEGIRRWYLHDGTPPYFAPPVSEWLNNYFPIQWVGSWPPRPPDLNPCDFCLWGWTQQCPQTIEKLQQ